MGTSVAGRSTSLAGKVRNSAQLVNSALCRPVSNSPQRRTNSETKARPPMVTLSLGLPISHLGPFGKVPIRVYQDRVEMSRAGQDANGHQFIAVAGPAA